MIEIVDDTITLHHPPSGRTLVVSDRVLGTLIAARVGLDEQEQQEFLGDAAESVVATLSELGLLHPVTPQAPVHGEGDAQRIAAPNSWEHWGPLAWAYHQRARACPPSTIAATDSSPDTGTAPPPSPLAGDDEQHPDSVLLPVSDVPRERGFLDVLAARRTCRRFRSREVSQAQLGFLLAACFGRLGPEHDRSHRAPIAAGGVHESRATVFAHRVHGLRPGIYQYSPEENRLSWTGSPTPEIDSLTGHQGAFRDAAAGLFVASDSAELARRYPSSNSYRILHNNVGALAQVFCMAAEALGLGAVVTGTLDERAVERMLRMDDPSTFVSLVMAVGHPSPPPLKREATAS